MIDCVCIDESCVFLCICGDVRCFVRFYLSLIFDGLGDFCVKICF